MTLPPRLSAVAAFVPPCDTLADIGTDHAYIPIYVVQKGVAKRAVASDISIGPADIARSNIERYGLGDKISAEVGYGLEKAKSADVIVIAGMGGKLVCDIIEAELQTARSAKALILQPMTAVEDVRRFLHEKDFTITQEAIAKEDKKLYNIMAVRNGKENIEDEIYYYIGKRLIEAQDKHLGEYILKRINSLDIAIANMKGGSSISGKRDEFIMLKQRLSEVYDDYCS